MSSLYGLVLAGGQSSRMGQNKALLNWQGKPLFIAMAQKLEDAGADHILISGSHQYHNEKYGQSIADRIPGKGPLSGIHAALFNIPDNGRLLVTPVDMPLLSSDCLRDLAASVTVQQPHCYFHNHMLPVCFTVTPDLRERVRIAINSPDRKDYSIRRLLMQLQAVAIDPPAQEPAARFQNTNTPEEWLHCQTIAEKTSA